MCTVDGPATIRPPRLASVPRGTSDGIDGRRRNVNAESEPRCSTWNIGAPAAERPASVTLEGAYSLVTALIGQCRASSAGPAASAAAGRRPGGSLTISTPPAAAAAAAHRTVIGGSGEAAGSDHVERLRGALGERPARRRPPPSTRSSASSAATARRSRSARVCAPLDEGDLQIVRQRTAITRPGKATARTQIGEGPGRSRESCERTVRRARWHRRCEASPMAPRAWIACSTETRRVVSHSPGR